MTATQVATPVSTFIQSPCPRPDTRVFYKTAERRTHRRFVLGLLTIAALVCTSVNTDAMAQQKSLKEQLVGAWTLMLISTKLPDGSPVWGSDPMGLLILTDNGIFSLQVMRSDRPKFASNSRVQGTPEENKAAVQGSISSFGTYTVDEANKTFTLRYLGSTFPNRESTEDTWPVVINGDELRMTHPSTSVGGLPSHSLYRRVK
jgi:Lipocalin-like domain